MGDDLLKVWRGSSSPTLKDVARGAGVSESAASTVLNGTRSHTRVSAVTRDKLRKVAVELGYRPNAVARALSSGRTNRIGVYVSSLIRPDPFWSTILSGICQSARSLDLDVVIHTSSGRPDRLLEMVSDRTVDGLIVDAHADNQILPLLEECHVPAVAVVNRVSALPSVCVDDFNGGVFLARHLSERGHRSVLALESNVYTSPAMVDRLSGFMLEAERSDIYAERTDFDWEGPNPLFPAQIKALREGGFSAVVAHNDIVAARVLSQLEAHGFRVPDRVAVTGFDGFDLPFVPRLPLTTIMAGWFEVAQTGMAVLMKFIDGEPVPSLTVLPVQFKQGAST